MYLPIRDRSERNVRRPRDDVDFEKMCVDVYAEVHGTVSAVRNGERGATQNGRDILMIDWSRSGAGYGSGVWVQCKHTEKRTVEHAKVVKDIKAAAELARASSDTYGAVRRFVVASSGVNDQALRSTIAKLNETGSLPFYVELHCWDWICEQICKNTSLWARYNDIRDGGLTPGLRIAVDELTADLREMIALDRLADAKARISTWIDHAEHQYPDVPDLFIKAWEGHWALRDQMLSLHERAGDMGNALRMVTYANELPEDPSADGLLPYVRTRRIVQGFSPNQSHGSTATGLFSTSMGVLWGRISSARVSPDRLSALALIAFMETNDADLHENILDFLNDLCVRSHGTPDEAIARIGHAVVRFHYVARYGWTAIASRYAFGDLIDRWDEIRMGDRRLGEPFGLHEEAQVTIQGISPFDSPTTWGGERSTLATRLGWLAGIDANDLAELSRECMVYSAHLFNACTEEPLDSTIDVATNERVADAMALLRCVYDREIQDTARRFTITTTEQAFERILGQQALLRALHARDKKLNRDLLHHTQSLVQLCWHGRSAETRLQRVYVSSVYANPPARVVIPSPKNAEPVRFTLLQHRLWELGRLNLQNQDECLYRDLLTLYESRGEPAMACFLALASGTPMLEFVQKRQILIAAMGIGADSPYGRRIRYGDCEYLQQPLETVRNADPQ